MSARNGLRTSTSRVSRGHSGRWRLPGLIIAAGVLAYLNSFNGTYVYDELKYIITNDSIRQLWPPWDVLQATRRPIVNVTLAINYAFGGLEVWGYHLFNLIVHLLAGLILFGVARRSFARCEGGDAGGAGRGQAENARRRPGRKAKRLRDRPPTIGPLTLRSPDCLALTLALIWVVHPLQTQSVTYLIQRAESMMGCLYLLTLYCVIRGAASRRGGWWYAAAVASCAMGMGCKAVMVTAPVVILLYDRAFLAHSFGSALRRRWGLYLGLASTWLVLGMLGVVGAVLDPGNTRVTVGLGYEGATPWQYLLTQSAVICHYLKLSVWPTSLCLDYGWPLVTGLGDVVLPALIVVLLLAVTVWASWTRPRIGFLGVWFFAILAPTSSLIPIKDPAYEHRMYLPLAAVIALAVIGGDRCLRWGFRRWRVGRAPAQLATVVLILTVVALLAFKTARRNVLYHSRLAMWEDVAAKRPDNPRAWLNVGVSLARAGRHEDAIEAYQTGLALDPTRTSLLSNLGAALDSLGRFQEAIKTYQRAFETDPDYPQARFNYGNTLRKLGRLKEAAREYARAIESDDQYLDAWVGLGHVSVQTGDIDTAIRAYRRALQIDADRFDAIFGLGIAFASIHKWEEAERYLQRAGELRPGDDRVRRAVETLEEGRRSTP